MKMKEQKFELGQTVMTRGVHELVKDDGDFYAFVMVSLARHARGDWGDICREDMDVNEDALRNGERLFSAYKREGIPNGKIWIITEADRKTTTVLFPSEY